MTSWHRTATRDPALLDRAACCNLSARKIGSALPPERLHAFPAQFRARPNAAGITICPLLLTVCMLVHGLHLDHKTIEVYQREDDKSKARASSCLESRIAGPALLHRPLRPQPSQIQRALHRILRMQPQIIRRRPQPDPRSHRRIPLPCSGRSRTSTSFCPVAARFEGESVSSSTRSTCSPLSASSSAAISTGRSRSTAIENVSP